MAKKNPWLSIGLPVFNGEKYLEEALDSILSQTFVDFELIIADNASTDRTPEICKKYAARDSRISYYRNRSNIGAASNYNLVFELASGEYFKWAAHDDVCAPQFLERCIQVLDEQPEIVLCYPKTILIGEQSEYLGEYADELHLLSDRPHERYHQFFDTQGLCHAVFGIIRSAALNKTALIGHYNSSDRVLLGELALYGKFFEIDEKLFYRRIHQEISTTANTTDSEIAVWFDPAKKGRLVFPKWRRLVEYFCGIKRSPLSWSDKTRCYVQLARFAFFPERWSGLVADLISGAKQVSRPVQNPTNQ